MAVVAIDTGATSGEVQPTRKIDLQYFITPPGICKVVQFVLGVILLFLSKHIFLAIVNYLAFTFTFLWIFVYIFSLRQRYAIHPPWVVLEFYYTAGAFLLFALATLIGFILFNWIASVFALGITIAFGGGAFFLFRDWREWQSNPDVPK